MKDRTSGKLHFYLMECKFLPLLERLIDCFFLCLTPLSAIFQLDHGDLLERRCNFVDNITRNDKLFFINTAIILTKFERRGHLGDERSWIKRNEG